MLRAVEDDAALRALLCRADKSLPVHDLMADELHRFVDAVAGLGRDQEAATHKTENEDDKTKTVTCCSKRNRDTHIHTQREREKREIENT